MNKIGEKFQKELQKLLSKQGNDKKNNDPERILKRFIRYTKLLKEEECAMLSHKVKLGEKVTTIARNSVKHFSFVFDRCVHAFIPRDETDHQATTIMCGIVSLLLQRCAPTRLEIILPTLQFKNTSTLRDTLFTVREDLFLSVFLCCFCYNARVNPFLAFYRHDALRSSNLL